MLTRRRLAFETDCHHLRQGCGFPAPGLHSFLFEPICTVGGFEFNKPMLLALLSTAHRRRLLLGRLRQGRRWSRASCRWSARPGYDFVRRGIVYETLGKKEGEKYVPLMVSLFFFIWIMNIWSIIPLAQFPVTSIIAYPMVLAADRLRRSGCR